MVESTLTSATSAHEPQVTFYEKITCCNPIRIYKDVCSNTHRSHLNVPLHYPLRMCQNRLFPGELVLANTDFSMKIVNLETSSMQDMQASDQHTKQITALHCPSFVDGELAHVFMSAGEDGIVKIWDRRSAQAVASVTTNTKAPIFSVSSN